MQGLYKVARGCAVAVLLGAAAATAQERPKLDRLEQGWSEADRNWFYTTTQGSRLVPLKWFAALEQAADQAPLTEALTSESLYLEPASADENPHGLPLGFVPDKETIATLTVQKTELVLRGITVAEAGLAKQLRASISDAPDAAYGDAPSVIAELNKRAIDPENEKSATVPRSETWVGMTCAACHTAEFRYQGKRFRVDGGPAMADFSGLLRSLVESLRETTTDEAKFRRFADKVLEPQSDDDAKRRLRSELEAYTNGLAGLEERSRPVNPFGYARLDAFGILTNEIVGTALRVPSNYRTPDAPVSYPHLWDTPNQDWVQWNGSAHVPMARNVGEALGVFADLALDPADPRKPASTSANVKNLHLLEERIKTLRAPNWPSEILGALDAEKVKRGSEVYAEQNCASCHAREELRPNDFGRLLIATRQIDLLEIGTDSAAAMAFLGRTGDPGIFRPFFPTFPKSDPVPIPWLLTTVVGKTVRDEFARLNLTEAEQLAYSDRRVGRLPTIAHLHGYRARDLAGIWATAPYLHNGSVPTLDDLFRPARNRPSKFHVGSREFDPVRVGFVSVAGSSAQEFGFDTSVPGNGNGGHSYGTSLNDDDRAALVEYLKSL